MGIICMKGSGLYIKKNKRCLNNLFVPMGIQPFAFYVETYCSWREVPKGAKGLLPWKDQSFGCLCMQACKQASKEWKTTTTTNCPVIKRPGSKIPRPSSLWELTQEQKFYQRTMTTRVEVGKSAGGFFWLNMNDGFKEKLSTLLVEQMLVIIYLP